MNGAKLSFSLTNPKKTKKSSHPTEGRSTTTTATTSGGTLVGETDTTTTTGFEPWIVDDSRTTTHHRHPDLPREPLIIPVQKDGRQSLQEQARLRRLQQQQPQQQQQQQQQESQVEQVDQLSQEHKNASGNNNNNDTDRGDKNNEDDDDEDQAAIDALTREATFGPSDDSHDKKTNHRIIQGSQNTFQRGGGGGDDDQDDVKDETVQFQNELERLAPELSVDSTVYQQVPISEFGAAMLRGMGWEGQMTSSSSTDNNMALPRPSRLGLGATPKAFMSSSGDAVPKTHSRMKRQDQVQREEQLKQQQQEYEQRRIQQIKLDKQRTIQEGSIVLVSISSSSSVKDSSSRRAIIRKWQGVPGLNMCLIQFEQEEEHPDDDNRKHQDPVKVRKGDVQLIDREDLHSRPFLEPRYDLSQRGSDKVEYLGLEKDKSKEEHSRNHRRRREDDDDDDDKKDHDRRHRREDRDGSRRESRSTREKKGDRDTSSRRQESSHRREYGSDDDDQQHRRRKHPSSHRDDEEDDSFRRDRKRSKGDIRSSSASGGRATISTTTTTWLIPHIRVRIISTKMGKEYYKEKGIVVDVTRNGIGTLTMDKNRQILQVSERYLETALPKVGGNVCILMGDHRWSKGRLLERDSKQNRGSIQIYEDMNIVTTSLDDLAEWCRPLDDDLME